MATRSFEGGVILTMKVKPLWLKYFSIGLTLKTYSLPWPTPSLVLSSCSILVLVGLLQFASVLLLLLLKQSRSVVQSSLERMATLLAQSLQCLYRKNDPPYLIKNVTQKWNLNPYWDREPYKQKGKAWFHWFITLGHFSISKFPSIENLKHI